MLVSTLLPILALLASPSFARTEHPNAARAGVDRRNHRHLAEEHARNIDKVAEAVERREALAESNPRALALAPRIKKRGAKGCRAKGSSYAASTTSAASTATQTSSAAQSSATVAAAAAEDNYAVKDDGGSKNNGGTKSDSSSSAAPAATSATSTSNHGSAAGLTPNGNKAGVSGGDTFDALSGKISWWYDWNAVPSGHSASGVNAVSMLWGNGHTGGQDSGRLSEFQSLSYSPKYIMGFYEPDCYPPMSSDLDPDSAAALWKSTIVPHRNNGGSVLISPGMCKQKDETWLTPFKNAIGDNNMWDVTAVHINKLNAESAKQVIDHYWNTYQKPIWVTEFACVDDQNGFTPSTDQGQINGYINDMVDLLEGDSRVYAYAFSNGEGLGNVWPMMVGGSLTESGRTYINAISKYH